ncbi:antirestriction protein [Actinokineospora baliensis]|nr:antirestriction protein [Actinokineospora baliensis]
MSDYNDGYYHGRWFEIDQTTEFDELMTGVQELLASSRSVSGPAEEWAIHDHEGFCGYDVGEYASLREVVAVGAAISEHGAVMAAWLNHDADELVEERIAAFDDAYVGEFGSVEDWALSEFEELYPEVYKVYCANVLPLTFDWQSYAETSDYLLVKGLGGEVAVLRTYE